MAKFRFRLDPVLGYRQRLEDEQQLALAAALAALRSAEAVRDDYIARRTEMRERLSAGHGAMDAVELRAAYAHCGFLDRSIEAQQPIVAAALVRVNEERAKLVVKSQEKKVLAVLKERRRASFDSDASAAEQREDDEINARRFDRHTFTGETPT